MPELLVINRNMPTYGEWVGEIGRVVPKMNYRNDPLLIQRGYIAEFVGRTEDLVPCEECGALFTSYSSRDSHVVKSRHSQQDGHVTATLDPQLARTAEQEAKIASPRPMDETEPGGFLAQMGEVDSFGRTVPAEHSENAKVRQTARRGRPKS